MHVWSFYNDITANSEAVSFLMGTAAPQQVFVASFLAMCKSSDETIALMEGSCTSGHTFEALLTKMSQRLFNFFAKNRVNDFNSGQHKLCKRKKDLGITPDDQNIKKLQSQ